MKPRWPGGANTSGTALAFLVNFEALDSMDSTVSMDSMDFRIYELPINGFNGFNLDSKSML